ncbi:MAG: protein-L-isoaspartate O-methyltransferase, partial [Solirubrobacterales bacterium]|nr:protein-L-isoaspartate O-methyltransferase [Solirubrobacterales bacterium]
WTIERHGELAAEAQDTITELGIDNVTFRVGDGWAGWPEEAPFDAINVAAATGEEPPQVLESQVADGGRMVAPVGSREQHLMLAVRDGNRVSRRQLEAVQFVPLVHGSGE